MIAQVLVEVKAKRIDKTFSYLVPSELESQMQVGIRVLVPFGSRKVEGFVLKIDDIEKLDFEVKSIFSLIDTEPVLNSEMLELGEYISKKTFSTLISAYQSMLPTALKAKHGFVVNKKYDTYLCLVSSNFIGTSKAQENVLEILRNREYILKSEANKISVSAVKTLLEKGIIEEIKEEVYRLKNYVLELEKNIVLNCEQENVVSSVLKKKNQFETFLLHGVTGSGKTEVYMHIIEEVLKDGKEVIVLVPEISLTPQMVNIFKKRFGNRVAILHSRLSDGEKYDEWRKIERREVSIVIGARSAVFAPFTRLGLIIIDEEHTATYKQENNPRYHAVDVALNRGKKYGFPVVLGSATPSVESYTRAKSGIYTLLEMNHRINNQLPVVSLIDMKEEIKKGHPIISRLLKQQILEKLERKEQILILLNRRGYSTIISCHDCGYVDKCPNCDIPLTYHKHLNKMKCHYCNYDSKLITVCPECKGENLDSFGMGTEKLEQVLQGMFLDARIVRMDVDTTSLKGSHEKIITAFMNHDYDILIGTQMIAKGLDFPNVTLVGVVNGDASLNIPDFRSAERTFQLLSQVSGRAGRGNLFGNVIIQGFNIHHYSILTASNHDYVSFYKEEMKIRSSLKYPPFCNLALFKIGCEDYKKGFLEAQKICNFLKNKIPNVIVLGPSMANTPKINRQYFIQIILKYKKLEDIYHPLEYLYHHYQTDTKVNVEIDINPLRI